MPSYRGHQNQRRLPGHDRPPSARVTRAGPRGRPRTHGGIQRINQNRRNAQQHRLMRATHRSGPETTRDYQPETSYVEEYDDGWDAEWDQDIDSFISNMQHEGGDGFPNPPGEGGGDGGDERMDAAHGSSGTAIQAMMPILRPIHTRDPELCFKHRHTWRLRNIASSEWVVTNGSDHRYGSKIMSDYFAFPYLTMGGFTNQYERDVLGGFREVKFNYARYKVVSAQLFQDSLQGGTDLHYQNYQGADAKIILAPPMEYMPPYYKLYQYAITEPPADPVAADNTASRVFNDSPFAAKFTIQDMARAEFFTMNGYPPSDQGAYTFPTGNEICENRFKTEIPISQFRFEKDLEVWDEPVALVTTLKGTDNSAVDPLNKKWRGVAFANSGYINQGIQYRTNQSNEFMTNMGTIPVGPQYGHSLCQRQNQTYLPDIDKYHYKQQLTFMKLQDMRKPDNTNNNYTVEFTVETDMCVTGFMNVNAFYASGTVGDPYWSSKYKGWRSTRSGGFNQTTSTAVLNKLTDNVPWTYPGGTSNVTSETIASGNQTSTAWTVPALDAATTGAVGIEPDVELTPPPAVPPADIFPSKFKKRLFKD